MQLHWQCWICQLQHFTISLHFVLSFTYLAPTSLLTGFGVTIRFSHHWQPAQKRLLPVVVIAFKDCRKQCSLSMQYYFLFKVGRPYQPAVILSNDIGIAHTLLASSYFSFARYSWTSVITADFSISLP